jgi:hypothetical protein
MTQPSVYISISDGSNNLVIDGCLVLLREFIQILTLNDAKSNTPTEKSESVDQPVIEQ